MFGLFNMVEKYLSGGSVSVDGGKDGDWSEDKFNKGGLIVVVLNEGSGKNINKLYTEWSNIKSQKQWDSWAENVRSAKFGTYGTMGLLEIMENFGFKDSSKVSNLNKYAFINEIKDAINSHRYSKGGGVGESLEKELRKLQRDLNSSRLGTYREGDNSEEALALRKEREVKLARFNEVLKLLRESESKMDKGGNVVNNFIIPNTLLTETVDVKMKKGGKMLKYQLGDTYSNDFDYDGMLNMALTVNTKWSIEDLNKLFNSFEDVNYHSCASPLWKAIGYLKSGKNNLSAAYLIVFKDNVSKELSGEASDDSTNVFAQGGTLAQHKKMSKVMREFKNGQLKSHGKVITDRDQAIAIALKEAGISKKEAGGIIESFRLPAADFVAISNGGIPSYNTPLDHWDLHYENGGRIKNKN